MAYTTFKGLDEYMRQLQKLGKNTDEILGAGVYAMAGVVADEIKKNIEALPAISDKENMKLHAFSDRSELTEKQKAGLLESFGITQMENDNGYRNVKLGFDGYNNVKTKKYPKGQPNALIARTVESGSTYMKKRPFIRPAINKKKKEAMEKCKTTIDEMIYNEFK